MKKVFITIGFFLAGAQAFAYGYDNFNYQQNYQQDYQNYQVVSYENQYVPVYTADYFNTPIAVPNYGSSYAPDYQICPVAITRDLKVGSGNTYGNDEVTVLQDYLHDAGYMEVSPNGYFGVNTRQAVINFQRDNGITPTGTVGPMTRQALNAQVCGASYNGGGYHAYNTAPAKTTIIPTTYVNSPVTTTSVVNTFVPNQTYTANTSVNVVSTPTFTVAPTTNQVISQPAVNNGIAYYPYDPFNNNPLPLPSTLTISTPLNKVMYKEGDTMNIAWTITNANVKEYRVTLENTSGGFRKEIAVLPANTNQTSVPLTKELLDYLCSGMCDYSRQTTFKLNVTATLLGNKNETSELKASVNDITISRVYFTNSPVKLTPSKTPINSGETIKLFISAPTGSSWYDGLYGPYTISLRANCPSGTQVLLNGTPCGQTYSISQNIAYFIPEVTMVATNYSIVPQLVTVELTVTNAVTGQVVGSDTTSVIVQR